MDRYTVEGKASLGLELSASNTILAVHYPAEADSRFPYDCVKTHCIAQAHLPLCIAISCDERLEARDEILRDRMIRLVALNRKLREDIDHLQSKIDSQCGYTYNLGSGQNVMASTLLGLCDKDKGACTSCAVEKRSRRCAAGQNENGILNGLKEAMQEHLDMDMQDQSLKREQELAQAEADQSHKLAVARLETVEGEVVDLERQMSVLDLDGGGYARITYHRSLEEYYEASSEQGRISIKAAIRKGEAYIQRLQTRLGIDGSGLSSLQLEKQNLQEAQVAARRNVVK
ncbi:hypothetical protein LTR15_000417 [Elasticomyces elasticus]|nr:hypothetical protein LTR15_000417 [Elasticomyces elasticus]